MNNFLVHGAIGLLLILVGGCAANPTPTPTAAIPIPTALSSATTAPQATALAQLTATPAATPTLHPALVEATLPRLAARQYPGSEITTTRVLTVTDTYTQALVTYLSDNLKVSGIMNVPLGQGSFPAVVLVHGYYDPAQFVSGAGTTTMADVLARQGYVTFAPDLRGYGESEHAQNLYLSGYIVDVLNAGASLKRLAQVEPTRVGVWGHSMGGGLATRAMVVNDLFRAVVLYAPISGDNADLVLDPFSGEPIGVTTELAESVLLSVNDEKLLRELSPIHYFERVTAPVSIHIGLADDDQQVLWAKTIRNDLKLANKAVEYFEYPGQGHVIQGDMQKVMFSRVLGFLQRSMK
ncbi:MAG: alpha/beta fold hydrolase [Chloroflexi bacterium]|nr:alpha/beta fold hydrolase [Chloroflexota bacterium]